MSVELAVLLLSCGAAGVIDAIGGGGGMLTVPAFLAAGVPIPLLLGTNKATSCMGSLAALIRYARAGFMPRLPIRRWAFLISLSILGGMGGALLSQTHWILDRLKYGIPFLLFFVMAFLSWRWFGPPSRKGSAEAFSETVLPSSTAIGVAGVSAYDGLFGPGTGTFMLSFLESRGLSTVRANSLAKVFNVGSNLGALVWFSIQGSVVWRLGILGACAYLAGNFAGSGLVISQGQRVVRYTTLVMTGLLLLRFIWTLSR